MAIATAKALTETGIVPNAAAIAAAKQDFAAEKAKNLTPKQLAAFVFKPLFKRQASKVETAQQLAADLKDSNPNPAQLRKKLPAYLIEAIEYACSTTPNVPENANPA
jgi:hypothetical protein